MWRFVESLWKLITHHETAEFATAATTTTTAGITPQVTTNGTDSTSHGRYSILAAPPRLSVLR